MTIDGLDLRTIGWFSLVGLPYTLKFLWAPLMDRFTPPFLGRRRGWMVATQFALLSALAAVGRVWVGPTAGAAVEFMGWASFFLLTTVAALPGLVLLWWLRGVVDPSGSGQDAR